MKKTKLIILFLMIAVLSGCITELKNVKKDAVPLADTGYIFGRFHQSGCNSVVKLIIDDIDSGKSQYLVLECPFFLTGREDYVKIFPVKPGTYRITRMYSQIHYQPVGTSGLKNSATSSCELGFDIEPYNQPFIIDAGEAVYLGEITGYSMWGASPAAFKPVVIDGLNFKKALHT
ncbi:MAG TPA: hypothetical protein P5295_15630 [Spirochaetota bacterium]|nr:hypothetical protein [Spirochaetota bacterium]